MTDPTHSQDLAARSGLRMPVSPVPVDAEVRDVARETIEAEQWLQSTKWRELVLGLASSKSDVFLTAYERFRSRIDALGERVGREEYRSMVDSLQRECTRWRRVAGVAIGALVLTFGVAAAVTTWL